MSESRGIPSGHGRDWRALARSAIILLEGEKALRRLGAADLQRPD